MQHLAYDWHPVIQTIGVRTHKLYPMLEQANFDNIVEYFRAGKNPYDTLADYLLYGAAAILGRFREPAERALAYHDRLNTKTKAVSLFFWAQEAIAHLQYQTAEGFLKPLLESHPNDIELNALMASCCFYQQELARGWPYMEKALENGQKHPTVLGLLCRYHLHAGNLGQAQTSALQLLSIDPVNFIAFNILSRVAPEKIDDRLVERFEHRAFEGVLGPVNSASLLFDIGRVYDGRGAYTRAFEAIEEANRLMRAIPQVAGQSFNGTREFESFCAQRSLFEGLAPLDDDCRVTPIFIVGLPRSGSTLLDQALSAHPQVTSLGENDIVPTLVHEAEALLKAGRVSQAQSSMRGWRDRFIERASQQDMLPDQSYLDQQGIRFIADKTLGNSRYIGFLLKLFPNARFLNCKRNIMDVGLSIYFSPLLRTNIYATDLTSIADFIAADERIIDAWKKDGVLMQAVVYEDMVEDMQQTLKCTFEHLGLVWHPGCLTFHKHKRAVHTYSAHQVRKAVYKSSKGRWQNYARHLVPFQTSLKNRGITGDPAG